MAAHLPATSTAAELAAQVRQVLMLAECVLVALKISSNNGLSNSYFANEQDPRGLTSASPAEASQKYKPVERVLIIGPAALSALASPQLFLFTSPKPILA